MPLSTLYLPPGRCERLPCVTIMCQLNLICPQNSFLSASVHLYELWSREDGRVPGSCSHVASSLPDGALTCMTMIPGSVPGPRQGFPGQNQVCFQCRLPEGPRDVSRWICWWFYVLVMMEGFSEAAPQLVDTVYCRLLKLWETLPLSGALLYPVVPRTCSTTCSNFETCCCRQTHDELTFNPFQHLLGIKW